jgi:hypothetical protein
VPSTFKVNFQSLWQFNGPSKMPVEANISCESIKNKDDNNWDQVINNLFNQISQSKQNDGSHEVDENEKNFKSGSPSGGGDILSTFELFHFD